MTNNRTTMSNPLNIRSMLGHALVTLILFCSMITLAAAQSTPTTPEKSKQSTQTATPSQQQTPQGWVWWDDNLGRELNIAPDRLRELRAVDDRYRKDYNALGTTPWASADYRTLTDRRNADIQKLLTPEQYQTWTRRTKPAQPTTPATPDR